MEWIEERCAVRDRLREEWRQIRDERREELREMILNWTRHTIMEHRITRWPRRILRYVFDCNRNIRYQHFKAIFIFCIGNRIPVSCAGKWILLRLAYSTNEERDRVAEEMIFKILHICRSVRIPGNRFRYYDIRTRQLCIIAPTEDQ